MRLAIISETVWPWRTPRPARPAATRRTAAAYSRHVIVWVSPGVRSATASGSIAALRWNASHSVVGGSDVVPVVESIMKLRLVRGVRCRYGNCDHRADTGRADCAGDPVRPRARHPLAPADTRRYL